MAGARPLKRGAYVGDVTALCALPSPPPQQHGRRQPRDTAPDTIGNTVDDEVVEEEEEEKKHDTLLAGVGATLQWYDPFGSGGEAPLLATSVFSAARVHGIVPAPELDASNIIAHDDDGDDDGTQPPQKQKGGGGGVGGVGGGGDDGRSGGGGGTARAVLVWGERRVALVSLNVGDDVSPADRHMRVVATLPPLGHWVHDVRPLAPIDTQQQQQQLEDEGVYHHHHRRRQQHTVAIGLAAGTSSTFTPHHFQSPRSSVSAFASCFDSLSPTTSDHRCIYEPRVSFPTRTSVFKKKQK